MFSSSCVSLSFSESVFLSSVSTFVDFGSDFPESFGLGHPVKVNINADKASIPKIKCVFFIKSSKIIFNTTIQKKSTFTTFRGELGLTNNSSPSKSFINSKRQIGEDEKNLDGNTTDDENQTSGGDQNVVLNGTRYYLKNVSAYEASNDSLTGSGFKPIWSYDHTNFIIDLGSSYANYEYTFTFCIRV